MKQIRFDILLLYFWMFVFFGAGHGDSIVGAERSGIIMRGVLDVFFSNDVSKIDVRCATVGVHFFLTCKFTQCVCVFYRWLKGAV